MRRAVTSPGIICVPTKRITIAQVPVLAAADNSSSSRRGRHGKIDKWASQATMSPMTDRTPPSSNSESSRGSVLRGAGIMTLMTALSRVLKLVREQVEVFTFERNGIRCVWHRLCASQPASRLFAEGMTVAFVPVFADFRGESDPLRAPEFLSEFITWLSFLVTLVTGVAYGITPG